MEVLSPNLNVNPFPQGGTQGDCVTNHTQPDLRAGEWSIAVRGTVFGERCQKTLNNGLNVVQIKQGQCPVIG